MQQDRREFFKSTVLLTGTALIASPVLLTPVSVEAQVEETLTPNPVNHGIFVNQYTVNAYYAREGINLIEKIDECFAELKEAGFVGFEATVNQADEIKFYIDALTKAGLTLGSFYTTPNLHDEGTDVNEIKRVLAIAETVMKYNAEHRLPPRVVVVNLSPKEGKSDVELNRQNKNLDTLGAALRGMGLRLAVHYHTTELQFAGREFHGFMCNTSPRNVSLCFDTHWSYRASGNSAVCVYDHAKLYGRRVAELHLRQSQNGVWTETFIADADFDHNRVLGELAKKDVEVLNHCHIVLEQAPEHGTPHTLKPLDVFKQSVEAVKKMNWTGGEKKD